MGTSLANTPASHLIQFEMETPTQRIQDSAAVPLDRPGPSWLIKHNSIRATYTRACCQERVRMPISRFSIDRGELATYCRRVPASHVTAARNVHKPYNVLPTCDLTGRSMSHVYVVGNLVPMIMPTILRTTHLSSSLFAPSAEKRRSTLRHTASTCDVNSFTTSEAPIDAQVIVVFRIECLRVNRV